MRRFVVASVAVLACLTGSGASAAHRSTKPHLRTNGDARITICHRTDSDKHPYRRLTISVAGLSGHQGHTGDVWFFGHAKEPKWGDIIPPTDHDGNAVAPLNWNTAGVALWNNGCHMKFGPPPGHPTVTCTAISIDPPPATFITVTFIGEINGVPFSRSASYGSPTPHIAVIDISDLTTGPGPFHIVVYAVWTLGPGSSHETDATIECLPQRGSGSV